MCIQAFSKVEGGAAAAQYHEFEGAVPHAYRRPQPPARRVYESGLISNPTGMAWRPNANLIDGELDNRTPGKVTGCMNFFRRGMEPLRVTFDLAGDFHEDIRGKRIRLSNPAPSDENIALDREGTYMKDFASVQQGQAGDITAGLPLGTWSEELTQQLMSENKAVWDKHGITGAERRKRRQWWRRRYRKHVKEGDEYFAYVEYPYIEWYSDRNGRVVLELDAQQVEVLDDEGRPWSRQTPRKPPHPPETDAAPFGRFLMALVVTLRRRRQKRDKRTSRKG